MQVCKTFAKIAKKKFSNTITYFVVFFVLLIAFSFQADSTSDKQFAYRQSICASSIRTKAPQAKHYAII